MIEVDAAGHDRDLFPRRPVTIVDQLRDLFAAGDDAIAARHHAIIEAFQNVLFAKAFVPAGNKGNAAQPRRDAGAPGAGAAERVNDVAVAFARQFDQRGGVAQHDERIFAGDVEWNVFGAGGGDIGEQSAGARHHDGAMPRAVKNSHQLDRADFGGADIERRHDDHHVHRGIHRSKRRRITQMLGALKVASQK